MFNNSVVYTNPIIQDIFNIQIAPGHGNSDPTLSYNPSGVTDWGRGMQYLDLMKMARPWIAHEHGRWGGGSVEGHLDENGWPTQIPEDLKSIGTIWVWRDRVENAGTYVLRYEGEGEIRLHGDVRVVDQRNGEMLVELGGNQFELNIRETDPDASGNNIRNVSLIREDHIELWEAGAVFNPDWVEIVEDAREMRFMDWMVTNNSQTSSWDERPVIGGPQKGVSVEDMVHLANQVGANPWFTMPHMADDEYVRNFAEYVRDNLDSRLKVKLEYSNELWNFSFAQTHWLVNQARDVWGTDAGDGYINYHVKRATEIALIWEDVFGEKADDRIIDVISTQTAHPGITKRLLDAPLWKEMEPDNWVDPKTVFEELGITTYFGGMEIVKPTLREDLYVAIDDPDIDAHSWLYERLLDPEHPSSLPNVLEMMRRQEILADEAGLRLVAYEGGQHLHHHFSVRGLSEEDVQKLDAFFTQFVRSPEVADLYARSWADWTSVSEGAYMQFGDITKPSKWGSWGVYEALDEITLRGQVLEDFNATQKRWWEGEGGDQYLQGITFIADDEGRVIIGTGSEDYLIGGDGDDILRGGLGDDGLHGGEGFDRALLSGKPHEYTIERSGMGWDMLGPDGNDFIVSIEEIHFSDGSIATLQELSENSQTFIDTSVGVSISSLNKYSSLGSALGMSLSDHVFLVAPRNASVEFNGITLKANYFSIHEGKVDRDSAPVTADVLSVARAFGDIKWGIESFTLTSHSDTFFGRGENVKVDARAGNDTIQSGWGNDIIDGGSGNDWIDGGRGDDILTGGEDADTFIFYKNSGHDVIKDFTTDDKVQWNNFFADGHDASSSATVEGDDLIISNSIDTVTFKGIGLEALEWF